MASARSSSFHRRFAGLFEIDPRSLTAFRIALGIVLLVDLLIRATSLEAFYTDGGAMPSPLVAQAYDGTWRWSLHFYSGTMAFQSLLFAAAGLAAACLTIGFYAPLATVICWLLWASVQTRTPLLHNGGDDLLRMLLFWSMFIPLPSRAFASRTAQPPRCGTSTIASAAILLQVCLMYFLAGSWKLTGDWINGSELHRIFCDGSYARPLAYSLQAFPAMTSIAGTIVVFAEHLLPVLLLVSPRYWRLRSLVIATLALMHLGIEFTLTVGLFSFVCWTALLLFVPAGLWDFLARLLRPPRLEPAESSGDENHSTAVLSPFCTAVRVGTGVVVLLSLSYVVTWNLAARGAITHKRIPVIAKRMGELLSLQQNWRIFDYASNRDGWFIVLARLPEFQYFDLLRDGVKADEVTFSTPVYPYRQLPDHRWRKLFSNLENDRHQAHRESLCRYLARHWERHHGEHGAAEAIELHYMQELNDPQDPDAYMQRFLCILELDAEAAAKN